MKKRELTKSFRRLCSLLLAAVLSVSTLLPVLADPATTTEEHLVIDIMALTPGQILQPGDVLSLHPVDQNAYQFIYLDCTDEAYFASLADKSVSAQNESYSLLSYESANFQNKTLSLSSTDFKGWRVVSSDEYNSGCTNYYRTVLMAEPETSPVLQDVTCSSSLSTVSGNMPADNPTGAEVQLFGFDTETGKPLEKDPEGNLIASPGDVIYACTSPVEGYCSSIEVETKTGSILDNTLTMLEWRSIDSDPYQNIIKPYSDYTFLPKEPDYLTAFAMPKTDATVKAVYYKTEVERSVEYYEYDARSYTTFKTDTAPVNSLYTLWDPKASDLDGRKLVHWEDYTTLYYQKGESIRLRSNYSFESRFSNSEDFTISGNTTFRTGYFNRRDNGSLAYMVEAVTATEDDYIFLEADPSLVPAGKTISGYQVTVGKEVTPLKFPAGLLKTIIRATKEVQSGNYVYMQKYSPITGPAVISLLYSDETPKDLVIDLSEDEMLLQKPSEGGSETDFIWNALSFPDENLHTTSFLEYGDLFYVLPYLGEFESYFDMKYDHLPRFIDLNGDGLWDLSMRPHAHSKTITWQVLPGADACEESVYNMTLNREGYGNLVFKLKDRPIKDVIDQKDTDSKEEDKKETGKDEGSKESEKKTEKTEEIAKTPAVGDEIKDEKTGNTYKVTAVGKENTVTLTKAAVKKKTAVIPATVTIGGITYKVTAVDANLLKNQKVTTLELGENIAKIPVGVIKNNKNLKTLKIKNSKKVINLTKKYFKGRKGKLKVYVSKKLFAKYKKMLKAKKITSKVTLKKLKK